MNAFEADDGLPFGISSSNLHRVLDTSAPLLASTVFFAVGGCELLSLSASAAYIS
jgi:hypothetical protein